jgi:hypothetical protein
VNPLEEIRSNDGSVVAIVVNKDFKEDGMNFLTKDDFPLQLGINSYKKGHQIKEHLHLNRSTIINCFQEVVYIKKGRATVKLYDSKNVFLKSIDLSTGDLIFLASGGHGFDIREDTTIIEIKQGPYFGKEKDKVII